MLAGRSGELYAWFLGTYNLKGVGNFGFGRLAVWGSVVREEGQSIVLNIIQGNIHDAVSCGRGFRQRRRIELNGR